MNSAILVESKHNIFLPQESSFEVVPKPPHWNLCPGAESVMMTAIRHGAIMNVYEGDLLVKFRRKMAAVCLNTHQFGTSILRRGYWYCAVNPGLIDDLQENFASGANVFNPVNAQWAEMRPVADLEEFVTNPQYPSKSSKLEVVLDKAEVMKHVLEASLQIENWPQGARCKGKSWKEYKVDGMFWEFPYEADLS